VKGTNFVNLRDAGDPVELGALYAQQGADELVFLDITATIEKRKTLSELVNRIAHHINIPFTVGGGIASVEDVNVLLFYHTKKKKLRMECGAIVLQYNYRALSASQIAFKYKWQNWGGHHKVCRSLSDVKSTIKEWGIVKTSITKS